MLRGGVLSCVLVGVVGWMIEYRAKRHNGGNEASLVEAKFWFQSVARAFPNMHITPHTLTQACAWVVWGAPHLLPRSVRQQLFPLYSWDTQRNARRGTEDPAFGYAPSLANPALPLRIPHTSQHGQLVVPSTPANVVVAMTASPASTSGLPRPDSNSSTSSSTSGGGGAREEQVRLRGWGCVDEG